MSTSSNRFLFFDSSRGQLTNKIITQLLSFSWWLFNLPIWPGLGKAVYSLHHRYFHLLGDLLANWLVSCGVLGLLAFSLQIGRLLLGAACQFIHPYKGNFTINRSTCTIDLNSTLQTSHQFLLVCKANKKQREKEKKKERVYIFE